MSRILASLAAALCVVAGMLAIAPAVSAHTAPTTPIPVVGSLAGDDGVEADDPDDDDDDDDAGDDD
ncbi:hypothetical protein Misp01_67430 [Microtetraspora sp. NBRC 13810]|uniref:hypothetical protein n=1 Tax=Microtetraspora sp. NBRC 13810 TaxID=3030990 RepID=UPI0024A41F9F|nr:hypothetical protein [Microtetraspora sp. NBRC 13810]GLW11615.1 hypothetical protein Misp01_67430 [Microtetraspora sp. NBRC 13810]